MSKVKAGMKYDPDKHRRFLEAGGAGGVVKWRPAMPRSKDIIPDKQTPRKLATKREEYKKALIDWHALWASLVEAKEFNDWLIHHSEKYPEYDEWSGDGDEDYNDDSDEHSSDDDTGVAMEEEDEATTPSDLPLASVYPATLSTKI